MRKTTFLLLTLALIVRFTNAQFSSEKIAEKILEADEYILSENYQEALAVLNELREKGTENANISYKTGLCYLNSVAEKYKALPLLKIASQNISKDYNIENPLEEAAPVDAMLYLGDAYRNGNKFKEAISCYKQYALLSEKTSAKSTSQQRIKECFVAEILQKSPIEIKWELMSSTINQGIANLNPVVSADGNILVFTRRMKFYDAIYITQYVNDHWLEPRNITTEIGSDGEYYPTALSADGKRLLLSCYNILSNHDIYESTSNGGRWSKLKRLDQEINTNFSEVNASYSPDGKSIFFASNRDNGFGGFDIYKSERRADNSWSRAINLGSAVNTKEDEKHPRLINHGKQLVFSSEGHFGMGGLDLFYINYPIESDSKAKNVGFPINSVNDDISYSPVLEQNVGFFAKHEPGSRETEIFKAEYGSFSNYFDIPVKTLLNISGLSPEDSISIFLVDKSLNDTIDQKKSITPTRQVDFLLYPGDFTLIAQFAPESTEKADFTVSENFQGITFQTPLSFEFKKSKPAEIKNVGKIDTVLINNLYFEFNSYVLQPSQATFLNYIGELMKNNPALTLTLTGYSDILGNSNYNLVLSEKRADAVLRYLLEKGISNDRIKNIGAGSTRFIAINSNPDGSDNPTGRSYNRRVELDFENIPTGILITKLNTVPKELQVTLVVSAK